MKVLIERLDDIAPVSIMSDIIARERYADVPIDSKVQREVDALISNLIEYRFYDPFDECLSELDELLTDEIEMAMTALLVSFFKYPGMVKRLVPDIASRVVILYFED